MPIASRGAVYLHGEHSASDLGLMFLVAFLLSYAVLEAACRVRSAHGSRRTAWLVGGSLVIGLGIFAFHFLGLLSVELPLPMTADPVMFGVSAVTAVIAAAGALHHVNRGAAGLPSLSVSAGLKGFALVGTHYTSVAALHLPAADAYRPPLILASAVVAFCVSAAGLALAERLRSERPAHAALERLAGALLMAGGLMLLHKICADAGRFTPDDIWVTHATRGHHLHHLHEVWLIPWVVGAGTIAVLGLAIAAAISRHADLRHRYTLAYDRLTGLANGAVLREHLAGWLAADEPCAVIAIRVKQFDELRRQLGRSDAERLLIHIGERLRAAARPSDLVACLGTGEFALLVSDGRPAVAREMVDRVTERLDAPFKVGTLDLVVANVVGAAVAAPGDTPRDVLQRAQLAAHRGDLTPHLSLVPEAPPARAVAARAA